MFGNTKKPQPEADPRVAAALAANEVKYETADDGDYRVAFELEGGRSHRCVIRSNTYEYRGYEIREITAMALISQGPFDSRTANLLLRQNEQLKVGAWGVWRNEDDVHAAVFTAKVAADLPPNDLLGVIMAVLNTADEMEARLSGRDDY